MAHVLAKDLRNAVLQDAIFGKLTDHKSDDLSVFELVRMAKAQMNDSSIDGRKVKKKDVSADYELDFDIPDNWTSVKLGEVCIIARGGSPRPINEYITTSQDGINWIKIGDTEKDGKYIFSTKEKIKPSGVKKSRMVHSGDFLLTNSMSFGRPYILKTDGCIHDGWLVISQPLEVFNQDYLYYLLSSDYAYSQFSGKVSGAVVKNLNSDKVADSIFPLPPIEEQARIVARVDELMAKIDEYEKLENQLVRLKEQFPKDMKDSLLQAGMMGKLTEQLSTDTKIDHYYHSVMEEKRNSSKKDITTPLDDVMEEELIDIPNNWMYVRLNDLVSKEIRRGKSPKYSETGTALAFAQKCNSKYSGVRLDLARRLDDSSLSRYTEEDNMHDKDIVINSTGGGTLGRVGLYEDKYNPTQASIYPDSHVTVVRPKKSVNAMYIYHCIKKQSEYLETLGEGSTNQTELKPQAVKDLIIPLPPIEEQARIVAKLDQLLPLVESLEIN